MSLQSLISNQYKGFQFWSPTNHTFSQHAAHCYHLIYQTN